MSDGEIVDVSDAVQRPHGKKQIVWMHIILTIALSGAIAAVLNTLEVQPFWNGVIAVLIAMYVSCTLINGLASAFVRYQIPTRYSGNRWAAAGALLLTFYITAGEPQVALVREAYEHIKLAGLPLMGTAVFLAHALSSAREGSILMVYDGLTALLRVAFGYMASLWLVGVCGDAVYQWAISELSINIFALIAGLGVMAWCYAMTTWLSGRRQYAPPKGELRFCTKSPNG